MLLDPRLAALLYKEVSNSAIYAQVSHDIKTKIEQFAPGKGG